MSWEHLGKVFKCSNKHRFLEVWVTILQAFWHLGAILGRILVTEIVSGPFESVLGTFGSFLRASWKAATRKLAGGEGASGSWLGAGRVCLGGAWERKASQMDPKA